MAWARKYCDDADLRSALLRRPGCSGNPTLARHRRVRGVTLTRLTDSVRCHIHVAIKNARPDHKQHRPRQRKAAVTSVAFSDWDLAVLCVSSVARFLERTLMSRGLLRLVELFVRYAPL